MHFSRARANKKIHFEHSSMVADVKGRGIKERRGDKRTNETREEHSGVRLTQPFLCTEGKSPYSYS